MSGQKTKAMVTDRRRKDHTVMLLYGVRFSAMRRTSNFGSGYLVVLLLLSPGLPATMREEVRKRILVGSRTYFPLRKIFEAT